MSFIKLNFELAIEQANRINKAATECENLAEMVKEARGRILEAWSGESANALADKLDNWYKEMSKLAAEQKRIAAGITGKAIEIRAIDLNEAAKELK